MASKPDESAEKTEAEAVAKAAEPPPELETDASSDGRPKLPAGAVAFHAEDTTLNVMPALEGQMLMSLCEGGFQYLLAGARASVGVKEGRYAFEISIVEAKDLSEPANSKTTPRPAQLVKVGVSTAASSLLLHGPESVCFDSEGMIYNEKQRQKKSKKFKSGQIVAVVVNLDKKSPNFNTVSLFCDGVRTSQPQKIPESMQGKPLFPSISFRNMSVRVNFGPELLQPLPFKCMSWQEAPKAACEVKEKVKPKGGKYVVLFPVGMPEEGTYDWLDQFLSAHKDYVEISDRSILEWANRSGVQRPKGYGQRSCVDKPEMEFGIPSLDDLSVKRVINTVAPALPRNYVVMDVKGNLTLEDRQAALARFSGESFSRVADVHVGEPPAAYRQWVQEKVLKEKQEKAEADAKRKKAEAAKKKAAEETRKKAEEMRKKKLDALKEKKKEGEQGDAEEKKEGEQDDAVAEAAGGDSAEQAIPEEKEEEEEAEVKVELTEEEKAMTFRKKLIPDLTLKLLNASYANFTLPSKDEGFDQVKYAWSPESKAKEYVASWVKGKKLTARIDDLKPSKWCSEQMGEWTKAFNGWKRRQADWKDPARKRIAELKNKKGKVKEEAEKAAAETVKGEGEEPANGDEAKEEPEDVKETKDEETKEEASMEVDADSLDVFFVDDINDIGSGEPIFSRFTYEDWTLLSLRYEIHLLMHAFARDVTDPDISRIPEAHVAFYYKKYFGKDLVLKNFGMNKVAELMELMEDAIEMKSNGVGGMVLQPELSDDTPIDNFVKLTEEHRRDRERRADLGDETVVLKFARQAPPQPAGGPPRPQQSGGGNHGGARGGQGQKRPLPPPSGPSVDAGKFARGPPHGKGAYGAYAGSPYPPPPQGYGYGGPAAFSPYGAPGGCYPPPPAYGAPPPPSAYGGPRYGYGKR